LCVSDYIPNLRMPSHHSLATMVADSAMPTTTTLATQAPDETKAFYLYDNALTGTGDIHPRYEKSDYTGDIPPIPSYEEIRNLPGQFRCHECLFCSERGEPVDVNRQIWVLLLNPDTNEWFRAYETGERKEEEEGEVQQLRACDAHRSWILDPSIQHYIRRGRVYLANGRGPFHILCVHAPTDSVIQATQSSTQGYASLATGSNLTASSIGSKTFFSDRSDTAVPERTMPINEADVSKSLDRLKIIGNEGPEPHDGFRCSLCNAKAGRYTFAIRCPRNQIVCALLRNKERDEWLRLYQPNHEKKASILALQVFTCDKDREQMKGLVEAARKVEDFSRAVSTPHLHYQNLDLYLMKYDCMEAKVNEQLGISEGR
jgi:hypothetical protein